MYLFLSSTKQVHLQPIALIPLVTTHESDYRLYSFEYPAECSELHSSGSSPCQPRGQLRPLDRTSGVSTSLLETNCPFACPNFSSEHVSLHDRAASNTPSSKFCSQRLPSRIAAVISKLARRIRQSGCGAGGVQWLTVAPVLSTTPAPARPE
jgi:hypothetical protein